MEELIDMASKNDEKWLLNYEALKTYIEEHRLTLTDVKVIDTDASDHNALVGGFRLLNNSQPVQIFL